MNVVNLDAYRKRRQAQQGQTVETTVPCGTCGKMLYLATHINNDGQKERLMVCTGCTMILTLGTENEGY